MFDSGLGSLSVIRAIQGRTRCEIVYLADRENFPYGGKTGPELGRIIGDTIAEVEERFGPDLIVVGSNTPTLMLPGLEGGKILGVRPPIRRALRMSRTGEIAVLATGAAVRSGALGRHVRESAGAGAAAAVRMVDCSELVGLVESGGFLSDREGAAAAASRVLGGVLGAGGADVAVLASTHLPFLRGVLGERFPGTALVDPAEEVAREGSARIEPAGRNSLRIYSTGGPGAFEESLRRLGVGGRISPFRPRAPPSCTRG